MLRTILSISGKPGLYKLISQGKNMLIVESLLNNKRLPAYAHDKVVSLGDIAIYTTEEEKQLSEVFQMIFDKYGKELDAKEYKTNDQLQAFFLDILPNYDQEITFLMSVKYTRSWS